MSSKNYYEILGVDKDSSANEIKKAYHKLSLKWHPDFWNNKSESEKKQAEEKMKELNQAYEVLSDPEKRKRYDTYGSEDAGFQGFGGGDWSGGFNQGGGSFFKDIFENFFGGRGDSYSTDYSDYGNYENNEKVARPGQDILVNLTLSFKESVLGTKKKISISLDRACNYCQQTGADASSGSTICSSCHGRGVREVLQRTVLGSIRTQTTCSLCQGSGKIIKKKCGYCYGKKFIATKEVIDLTIPRGIDPNKRLRYSGKGNDGLYGGSRGDIYVAIKVKENPYFHRKDNDIYVNLKISFLDAILGNKVELLTLEGKEDIQITPGSQNDDRIVLRGKGCYLGVNRETRGNLVVVLKVELPKKITVATEKILRNLQQESSWNPNKAFIEKSQTYLDS